MGEDEIPNITPPEGLITVDEAFLQSASIAELIAASIHDAELGLGGDEAGKGFSETLQTFLTQKCSTFGVDEKQIVSILECWAGIPPQQATPDASQSIDLIFPEEQLSKPPLEDPQVMRELMFQAGNLNIVLGLTRGLIPLVVDAMIDNDPGMPAIEMLELIAKYIK